MAAPGAQVRPLSIAIFALGGEGGGVLTDWIVEAAERADHLVQATSVPGVAQRTGATIYYLELFPRAAAAGREPVLALMPMPGDVDLVVASELMEAGRAVERGLVTPDRTTLIASTHRVYAIAERMAPGDERVDGAALHAACGRAAKRLVAFDMQALADEAASPISAALFGALAGSGALPFPRALFESVMAAHGAGARANLAAFAAAFDAASHGRPPAARAPAREPERLPSALAARLEPWRAESSEETFSLLQAGAARLADYQDEDYAGEYLRRLEPFRAPGGELLGEVARFLALAMAYEDAIRVAEIKTRAARFARLGAEAELGPSQVLEIADFFHPGVQEIADILPAPLGRALAGRPLLRRLVERLAGGGKIVRTSTVRGYLSLYLVAALKRFRRGSLRFQAEQAEIARWLDELRRLAARDPALAAEFAKCRGLFRGYGDTHARGAARYQTLAAQIPALQDRPDAAARLRQLREAALKDEEGKALADAIAGLAGERP